MSDETRIVCIMCRYWDDKLHSGCYGVSFGRPRVRIASRLPDPPLALGQGSRPAGGQATLLLSDVRRDAIQSFDSASADTSTDAERLYNALPSNEPHAS
jgi:hypothetical protein